MVPTPPHLAVSILPLPLSLAVSVTVPLAVAVPLPAAFPVIVLMPITATGLVPSTLFSGPAVVSFSGALSPEEVISVMSGSSFCLKTKIKNFSTFKIFLRSKQQTRFKPYLEAEP